MDTGIDKYTLRFLEQKQQKERDKKKPRTKHYQKPTITKTKKTK